ncbi:hypothetical protein MOP88_16515 [Sphingomonas sp. WKB10]|nr:hypothetical protein [Sphingomonas sp. WKB10]
MRFDDSLKTVLSADMDSGFGAQSAWRQLVDLMGRGRIAADEPGLARLRMLRQAVPLAVRSASARALAFATPPAPLVGLFAEDAFAVAAPLLRTVTLDADTWIALLPRLSPQGRALLRHRRDLPAAVERALESFGSVDFVLPDAAANVAPTPVTSDLGSAEVELAVAPTPVVDAPAPEPVVTAPLPAPVEAEPIVVAPAWSRCRRSPLPLRSRGRSRRAGFRLPMSSRVSMPSSASANRWRRPPRRWSRRLPPASASIPTVPA